jgi:hypothetical protein
MNKRLFKKKNSPIIKKIRKAKVDPEDVILVTVKQPIHDCDQEHIRSMFRDTFPKNTVIIIADLISVKFISPENTDNTFSEKCKKVYEQEIFNGLGVPMKYISEEIIGGRDEYND